MCRNARVVAKLRVLRGQDETEQNEWSSFADRETRKFSVGKKRRMSSNEKTVMARKMEREEMKKKLKKTKSEMA